MKKLIKENRILFALFIILIVCLIAIAVVGISYFVGSHKSVYGDRLEGKVKVSKDVSDEYINALKEDAAIADVTLRTSIRTIYVTIVGSESATLDILKDKATLSIEKLPEDIRNYYDINFILKKDPVGEDKGFILMGAKNLSSESVTWNNNTVSEEE